MSCVEIGVSDLLQVEAAQLKHGARIDPAALSKQLAQRRTTGGMERVRWGADA
jgi:hypothetical protein